MWETFCPNGIVPSNAFSFRGAGETQVWRLEEALTIALVFGPVANNVTPDVLRVGLAQPAKSASA
eukprot:12493326-Prorocentrum_lima.AAC.1